MNHSGKISAQVAERLALERYAEFDAKRKHSEQLEADNADIIELERIQFKEEAQEKL